MMIGAPRMTRREIEAPDPLKAAIGATFDGLLNPEPGKTPFTSRDGERTAESRDDLLVPGSRIPIAGRSIISGP
jgi:hypothetical protein